MLLCYTTSTERISRITNWYFHFREQHAGIKLSALEILGFIFYILKCIWNCGGYLLGTDIVLVGAKGSSTWLSAGGTISPTNRASRHISPCTLRVTLLWDGVHFFSLRVLDTARLRGRSSFICIFLAHRCKIGHAFWTLILAVATSPGVITFLTLWIEEGAKFLKIWRLTSHACTTPVPLRLHAIVGHVFEVVRAFGSTEDTRTFKAISALRIASIEAKLMIWRTLCLSAFTSTVGLSPARFSNLRLLFLFFFRLFFLWFFFFGFFFLGFFFLRFFFFGPWLWSSLWMNDIGRHRFFFFLFICGRFWSTFFMENVGLIVWLFGLGLRLGFGLGLGLGFGRRRLLWFRWWSRFGLFWLRWLLFWAGRGRWFALWRRLLTTFRFRHLFNDHLKGCLHLLLCHFVGIMLLK